jgi:hypothetical protein
MDRQNMDRAAQLLAKAQSTDYEAEAVALMEKCYVLLAGVIAQFEDESERSSERPRKRERRHLRDRRAVQRITTFATPRVGADPAGTYRRSAESTRSRDGGHVDLSA